jgi:hypothetical protein
MPEKKTLERARKARRQGKSPTTQAGEFVKEEIEHVREGKHGARSTKQAIAIGLSKARRAGVALPPPRRGRKETRESAARDYRQGRSGRRQKPSSRRSSASRRALKREGRSAASRAALSRQARSAARRRRQLGPNTPASGRSRRSRGASAKRSSRTSRGRARAS